LRIRFWLQYLTFLVMAGGLLLCGPWFLQWFGHGKQMLDPSWMLVLTLSTFLEWQTSLWGILISTENRIPYLWPSLASNALSLAIAYGLLRTTGLGVGALVLGPLITHSLFNYWYWPAFGARGIGTTWLRFHFSREHPHS
ncbi:MAG TPA: hypothetical protein VG897_04830, partial [Terriglobales bacterium]|nr:hypothetical protein [Terriglobales bacterium]